MLTLKVSDIGSLARSFRRTLELAGRSPGTVRTYTLGVSQFAMFLHTRGMPLVAANITRVQVEASLGDMLRYQTPATARTYYGGLQAFFDWLVARGELEATPMARVKPPYVPQRPTTMLSDAELRRLLRACQGAGFEERRDLAMLRLLMDTGLRVSEATYLGLDDVDATGQFPLRRLLISLGYLGLPVRGRLVGRLVAGGYAREYVRHTVGPHPLYGAIWA